MLGFFKKNKNYKIQAVVDGSSIDIEKVNDSTFSQKIMGDGMAIIPSNDIVVAPCDGKITVLPESKHAFGMISDDGVELLVHIGIDTVNLKGSGFQNKVSQGSIVKQGDPIIVFEREKLISQGVDCTTITIVLNQSEFSDVKCMTGGSVVAGENTVIEVVR